MGYPEDEVSVSQNSISRCSSVTSVSNSLHSIHILLHVIHQRGIGVRDCKCIGHAGRRREICRIETNHEQIGQKTSDTCDIAKTKANR